MTVEVITPAAMWRWRDAMRPDFTRRVCRVIADRVENLVRRHLLRIAPAHHTAADRLGATHTGHLTKGARLTHSTSGEDFAEVIIPIAGISRAFKDLTITPRNAAALTIPIAPQSYGQRVARMRQLGWVIFRLGAARGDTRSTETKRRREDTPPYQNAAARGHAALPRRVGGNAPTEGGVLMGTPPDGGEAVPLYLLKKRVHMRQDRTLLPSDEEIGSTAAAAITGTIDRIAKGAV